MVELRLPLRTRLCSLSHTPIYTHTHTHTESPHLTPNSRLTIQIHKADDKWKRSHKMTKASMAERCSEQTSQDVGISASMPSSPRGTFKAAPSWKATNGRLVGWGWFQCCIKPAVKISLWIFSQIFWKYLYEYFDTKHLYGTSLRLRTLPFTFCSSLHSQGGFARQVN